MQRYRVTARRKKPAGYELGNQDTRQGGRVGVGRQPGQATGRQGGTEGVGQQGGRGTARRTNAGNTRDSLRRKRRALAKVQHADESSARQGGRACARDVGWALIGVEVRSQPQRQPQAAELLRATMIAL